MKTVIIDKEILEKAELLKKLRNFKKIFRTDITYDNIKSHKKSRASHSL